jgi:hypothetical protein
MLQHSVHYVTARSTMPLIPVFFSIQQTLNFMKNKIFDLVAMGNPAFKSQVYPTALEAVPSGWVDP